MAKKKRNVRSKAKHATSRRTASSARRANNYRARRSDIFAHLPGFGGNSAGIMMPPVESWLKFQSEIWNAALPAVTKEWLRRRQAATADAIETLQKLSACKDFREVTNVQRAWFENAVTRAEEDIHAFRDHVIDLTQAAQKASQ